MLLEGILVDEQNNARIALGKPVQIGLVVRDAYRTADLMWSLFGIGPFRFVEWPLDRPDMKAIYRGNQVHYRMRLAFANLTNIEIELIQPLEGESVHTEALARHGEGLHHLLFDVPDPDTVARTMAEAGIEVAMSGTALRPGCMWMYLDTMDLLGWMVELRTKPPGSDGTSLVPPSQLNRDVKH